jgi:hypothetical protein
MKLKFTLLSACILFSMLIAQPLFSLAAETAGDEDKIGEKSAGKNRTQTSRNNTSVKIYPGALKRVMHVIAKENDGKQIDFFVFDLEGTLMKHFKMETGDHVKISGLDRGKYVYRVFTGDEETAAGDMEIR